jgi:hypothetical protein
MLKTVIEWFRAHKLYAGLALGSIGFLLFLAIYSYTNIAYIRYYGAAASCTNSTKLGVLVSAPVNYCEDRSNTYTTFQQGIDANMGFPALIIFAAIIYSWCFEKRFKTYLSFKMTMVLSVLSTYALSALNLVFSGKPAGGTSILAFDMLLFLFLGLTIDYTNLIKDRKYKLKELMGSQASRLVISLNRLVKKEVSKELAAIRAYNILKIIYLAAIAGVAVTLLLGYIPGDSAPLHMAGGFILLLYVFLANRKEISEGGSMSKATEPSKQKPEISTSDYKDEERLLFSIVITIVTFLAALVIALQGIVLNINSALNSNLLPAQNQVSLTCLMSNSMTILSLAPIALILLALFFRYVSTHSRLRWQSIFSWKFVSWAILLLALIYEILLILSLTCKPA